jgi:hypothetical protein
MTLVYQNNICDWRILGKNYFRQFPNLRVRTLMLMFFDIQMLVFLLQNI